jgi:hypothetical protein
MKKTYQIKINQGKESKTFEVVPGSTKGQALTIKAVEGARYQLVDKETTYGPENIRTSRIGKDLNISFEGSNTTDVVIEDYYKATAEGFNGLIGEAETGKFYEYIPENASGLASVPMLSHSSQVVGMALGGAEVASSGAAVGVLAAGLFSPWLLGAGALGVAAAAGGGGAGSAAAKDTTAPTGQTGALSPVVGSDSATLGDNKTNVTKPTITGKAEAGSTVEVSFVDPAGKVTGPYKTTADASGNYSLVVPDNLADNSTDTKGTQYTPVIKVTDASGNSSIVDKAPSATPFVVDNKAVAVLSVAIDADTNNDGLISAAEKGTATTTSVTAKLDKDKVVAGDVVTFSDGINSQNVTLKDTDITTGQVTSSGWKIPGEGVASTISAVLMDLAGNVSAAVKDMVTTVIDSLKTALTINPISIDNIITTTDGVATNLAVTGKVTGTFVTGDTVNLSVNGKNFTAQVDSNGNYSKEISMADFKAAADKPIEGKVTGTNGSVATASQSYVVETTQNTGKSTALFIDSITPDNILNFQETSLVSMNVKGTVTGKFSAGVDQVTLKVNGYDYYGSVGADGKFTSTVKISDLLADIDTIIDATVTGTGGTTAKAAQDYGMDTVAPTNVALTIDLDNGGGTSKYLNDGFINQSEKGIATASNLTTTFDSSKVSIGDVITFSDGTTTKLVTLDKSMVDAGSASTGWNLPPENGTLNVTAVLRDAADNVSNTATDTAKIDITAATITKTIKGPNSLLSEVRFESNETGGKYKLHIGDLVFTELTLPNGGKPLVSTDTLLEAKDIYFEHWDVAGNATLAYLVDAVSTAPYTVTSNTSFMV